MLLLDEALKLMDPISVQSPVSAINLMLTQHLLQGRALGKASEDAFLYEDSDMIQYHVFKLSATDPEEAEEALEACERNAEGLQYLRQKYCNASSFIAAVSDVTKPDEDD